MSYLAYRGEPPCSLKTRFDSQNKERMLLASYSAVVCCVLSSGGVALLMVALILGKAEVVFDCEGCKPSWAAAVF